MLSRRHVWSGLTLCAVLVLLAAPAALAQSAGNQQYVDPLASTTPTSSSPAPSPPTSTPQPTPQPTPSASAAPASTQPVSTPPAATSSSDQTTTTTSAQSSGDALPFTGLDLWPAVAVGVGLLGSGLAIRRLARRP